MRNFAYSSASDSRSHQLKRVIPNILGHEDFIDCCMLTVAVDCGWLFRSKAGIILVRALLKCRSDQQSIDIQ